VFPIRFFYFFFTYLSLKFFYQNGVSGEGFTLVAIYSIFIAVGLQKKTLHFDCILNAVGLQRNGLYSYCSTIEKYLELETLPNALAVQSIEGLINPHG
jgi:hypothetical protein